MKTITDNGKFTAINGEAADALKQANGIQTVITDPPYNRGFDYGPVDDDRDRDEYEQLIRDVMDAAYTATTSDASFFMIHYPEDIARLWPILTDKWNFHQWVSWCYPANFGHSDKKWTKAHRAVLWLKKREDPKFYPDRVTQPYKNPEDDRVKKLMENGSDGTHLYNWWEIDLCKNVSGRKRITPIRSRRNCFTDLSSVRRMKVIR